MAEARKTGMRMVFEKVKDTPQLNYISPEILDHYFTLKGNFYKLREVEEAKLNTNMAESVSFVFLGPLLQENAAYQSLRDQEKIDAHKKLVSNITETKSPSAIQLLEEQNINQLAQPLVNSEESKPLSKGDLVTTTHLIASLLTEPLAENIIDKALVKVSAGKLGVNLQKIKKMLCERVGLRRGIPMQDFFQGQQNLIAVFSDSFFTELKTGTWLSKIKQLLFFNRNKEKNIVDTS